MSNYERMARIDGMDLETGTFPVTLATEGEASDGHILSIKGGQIPERLPLQISHINDPLATQGSLTEPRKHLKDSPPRLGMLGQIEMGGEGSQAEVRRDLAYMIAQGHVTGMSIRWEDVPGKTIRRINLPSDHPYHVSDKAEGPERWGLFFEEWRALEGSIVAVGADQKALIGRAEETDGEVRTFWRSMAEDAGDTRGTNLIENDGRYIRLTLPPEPVVEFAEPKDESSEAKIAARLAALRVDAGECLRAGASHADCINAIVDEGDAKVEAVEIGELVVFLSEPAAGIVRAALEPGEDDPLEIEERLDALEQLMEEIQQRLAREEGRVSDVPPPSLEQQQAKSLPAIGPSRELFAEVRELLEEASERQEKFVRGLVERARGKVT